MAATSLIGKLTAIADAIRGKTGGTDELTLDAMAQAIAALETGGAKVAYGSIVSAEQTKGLEVYHGLGIVPQIAFIWRDRKGAASEDGAIYMGVSKTANILPDMEHKRSAVSWSNTINNASYTGPKTNSPLDTALIMENGSVYGSITSGDSEKFYIGHPDQYFYTSAGDVYGWVAIGGLS